MLAAKRIHLVSGNILPIAQKCIKFQQQRSKFEKFCRGRNPRTPYRGREGKLREGRREENGYLVPMS